MKHAAHGDERREKILAALLWYGTWIASAVIAAGMILGGIDTSGLPFGGHDVVKAGVALFICLPIARVALMLVIFLQERDYAYMAISALVLAIIGAGVVAGL